jgi:hypothetical protein
MIKNRYYHGEASNPFKLEDNRERYVFWGEEAIQARMLELHPDMPKRYAKLYAEKDAAGKVPAWLKEAAVDQSERERIFDLIMQGIDDFIGVMDPLPKWQRYLSEGIISELSDEDIMSGVVSYLDDVGVDPDSDDFGWYVPYVRIVDGYVHGKLSVREILHVHDKMDDLLTVGLKGFWIAFPLQEEERIRGQIRAFEFFDETKGKLAYDEKEAWAFCIYYAVCTRKLVGAGNESLKFDKAIEEAEFRPPLDEFAFPHKIASAYAEAKARNPGLFVRHESGNVGRFGFDPTNPINAISVPAAHEYLSRLYPNGDELIVRWDRKGGCVKSESGSLLDSYEASVIDQTDGSISHAVVFVDSYCESTSTGAPDGWTLVEPAAGVGVDGYWRMKPRFLTRDIVPPHKAFKMFREEWNPIGGWGYGPETASLLSEKDLNESFPCGRDLDKAKDMFMRRRLEFELRIVRQYRKLELFDLIEQKLVYQEYVVHNGKRYDKRHYLVTCLRQPDFDELNRLWQENNKYENDPDGAAKHHALVQSKLVVTKEPVWFQIEG